MLATSFNPFVIRVTGLQPDDTSGPVSGWNPMGVYQWNIATAQFGVLGFDPDAFDVDTTDFVSNNSIGLGREFSISSDGTNVFLHYGVIPEPSSAMLLFIGALGISILRKLRP